jgi:dTDP-4-amino-4,6-dideoxygalactose transaminase
MSRLGEALWRRARLPRTRIRLDASSFLSAGMGLLSPRRKASDRVLLGAFESSLAAFMGRRHALGVGSGKAALALAIEALELPRGSGVVVPSLLVPEVLAVISAAGLEPRIVDVDPNTFGLDAATVEAAIKPGTRAILPVHLYGTPCAVAEIEALADARGLLLLEDAAQAIGATLNGRPVGSFGPVSTVSLGLFKNVSTLEGGAVLTDDDALAARMRAIAAKWPPLPRAALLRTWLSWAVYGLATRPEIFSLAVHPLLSLPELLAPGWTSRVAYRPDPSWEAGELDLAEQRRGFLGVQAGIGVRALADAEGLTATRVANAAILEEVLSGVPGIKLQRAPAGARSIRLNYPVLIPERDRRLPRIRQESGVDLTPGYVRNVSAFPAFARFAGPCPVAARVEREHAYVPVQHDMPPEVFRERAERLKRALAR